MSNIVKSKVRFSWALPVLFIICCATAGAQSRRGRERSHAARLGDAPADSAATSDVLSSDFLSDDAFRQLPREERRRRWRERYVRQYDLSGHGSIEKLGEYIRKYADLNIFDLRLVVFAVSAEHVPQTTGSLILRGEVSLPAYKSGLESTLRDLGFNVVRNDIEALPSAQLGKNIYGVATTSAATIRKEPRTRAEQVNSTPMGGWMRLLREARADDVKSTGTWGRGARRQEAAQGGNLGPRDENLKWYLAQSSEGYVGFVREDEVAPADHFDVPEGILMAPAQTVTKDGPKTIPAGAYVMRAGDPGQLSGPARAWRVAPMETILQTDAKVTPLDAGRWSPDEILSATAPLMGVKYVWGGTTGAGIDCSGFTQFLYKSRGVFLPRDAEEQAIVGQAVAFAGEPIERKMMPGDLIFFQNEQGRVNHVAVSLGGTRVIHSSGKDVHTSELDEEDPDHPNPLRKRVLFVRRIYAGTAPGK